MRVCSLLDRYRDGELDPLKRDQFESHLRGCSDCRCKLALLNNLVCALQQAEPPLSKGLPERIARRAFEQRLSWDVLVISWLKPAPTWAALILAILLFVSVWMIPTFKKQEMAGEYEALVNEGLSITSAGGGSQIRGDDDLVRWLEEEGDVR
jgi:anti-sigma factor RsiW